jgi:manganese efflux pump family protein
MHKNNSYFQRLKTKWGVTSNLQLALIFIVFAITGSSAAKLASPVVHLFGIDNSSAPWVYWPARILLIFPLYQVLLVIFGWLFGQFEFFWNFEKKMLQRLGLMRNDQ